MKNKFVTKAVAGILSLAMVCTMTTVAPTDAYAKTKKTVTVTTQKQLNKALKDKSVKSIIIKTPKARSFKIKDADYDKKSLVVDAPKSSISNAGDFKKITIKDGKKFTERGEENVFVVKDKNKLSMLIGKQASDAKITVSSAGKSITIGGSGDVKAITVNDAANVIVNQKIAGKPSIVVNDSAKISVGAKADVYLNSKAEVTIAGEVGSVFAKADASISIVKDATVSNLHIEKGAGNVSIKNDGAIESCVVNSKANVNITGASTSAIPLESNVEGATITSDCKLDVKLNANANITLNNGAEGSTVSITAKDVKATVNNKTSEKIEVTDASGSKSTVDAGKTSEASGSTEESTGGTAGGSTGGSSGGSSQPAANPLQLSVKNTATGHDGIRVDDELIAEVSGVDVSSVQYSWYRGEDKLGEGASYKVSMDDGGAVLSVEAKVVSADNKEYTKKVSLPTPVLFCYMIMRPVDQLLYHYGTDVKDVLKELQESYGEVKLICMDHEATANVSWAAPENFVSTPGAIMKQRFTGTLTAPSDGYLIEKSITMNVIVKLEKSLKIEAKAEETNNENKKLLDEFTLSADEWGVCLKGAYLRVANVYKEYPIVVSAAGITDLQYRVGDSGEFTSTGRSNFVYNAYLVELLHRDVTLYLRSGTDDSTVTPFNVILDNQLVKMTALKTEYVTEYKDVDVTKGIPAGFPNSFEFVDADGNSYKFDVYWKPSEKPNCIGEQEYYPFIAGADDLADLNDVNIPNIMVTYVKGSQDAPAKPANVDVKSTSSTIKLTGEELKDKAFFITKSAAGGALQDSGICKDGTVTFDNLQPGESYKVFAYLPETDLKNRSRETEVGTFNTKGVLAYSGATTLKASVGYTLPAQLSFTDAKTGTKKDYNVTWNFVKGPDGYTSGALSVAGTYVFTATATVDGYDPVTTPEITVTVSKKAAEALNFDEVFKVTWVGTNTIAAKCKNIGDMDKFESIVRPAAAPGPDSNESGFMNGWVMVDLTYELTTNNIKEWSVWIRRKATNEAAASDWVNKQVTLADGPVTVTSVTTILSLPENLTYTKGTDSVDSFAAKFPTSMTVHAGEYSKDKNNLTWHVENGETTVKDINNLNAGTYTFIPDVHDADNLVFGDKLPKISVTVKD